MEFKDELARGNMPAYAKSRAAETVQWIEEQK